MSTLKKMPNEKPVRTMRKAFWWILIMALVAAALFRRFGHSTGVSFSVGGLAVVVAVGLVVEMYYATSQPCPECGGATQEVYEDIHPRVKDYHVLYCDRCDILWDTTIPKAKD